MERVLGERAGYSKISDRGRQAHGFLAVTPVRVGHGISKLTLFW